jgi:ribosomal protein L40E
MTRATLQPMKSRELAEEALPVLCYVCEATNTLHAEYCRRCSAPMALAHQAPAGALPGTMYSGSGSAARPKMVAVLGPSGSGKTVYLGMLMDMLSRQPQRLHIVARGAFSVGLQQTTVSALAHCEFPSKTGTEPECWNWVHCEIHREKAASKPLSFSERLARLALRKPRIAPSQDRPCVELVMPDMAGEAILEEVQHPQTFSAIRSLLRNSAAALLLIDAAELIRGHRDPDFAATKILSCLKEFELAGGASRRAPCTDGRRRPVALVFTKTDQAEGCRENPERFARTYAVSTWQHCQQGFRDYAFFAASVVGCCTWREVRGEARRRIPLRVEPHGIIEPFAWLVEKLHPTGRR